MTPCAEGLKVSTNLRYFSGKLPEGAVVNKTDRRKKKVKMNVPTGGSSRLKT